MTLAMTLDMTLDMTGEAPETAQEPSRKRLSAEWVVSLWEWLEDDPYEITAPREG